MFKKMTYRFDALRRFALTGQATQTYIRHIRKSGLFDRHFYLTTNPRLHPLFRLMPERHFAVFGEAMGLQPNPDFSPNAYLRHNPDLASYAHAPFSHFIAIGRKEQRVTKDLPVLVPGNAIPVPRIPVGKESRVAPYAVVAHVFYHDLWEELAEAIDGADLDCDLFVTITHHGPETDALAARITETHPQARVIVMPNHGRDIFPFVHLVNAGLLDNYQAVCKIHTKRSPHRQDGDDWRRHLIGGILPGAQTTPLVRKFVADTGAAFWVADGQRYTGDDWWGSNRATATHLLRRIEIRESEFPLSFPAGSIYWVKPVMIDMIRGAALTQDIFEPEQGQVDGTLAHAFERAIGHIAQAADMQILQTTELVRAAPVAQPRGPAYVSAFHLPQFHPTPENDAWWGRGYTEWAAVTRAKPRFAGHMHPQLPADLGFYDLRLPEALGAQAEMATEAGIDAFCVYHYWFGGKRVLQAPLDALLARQDIRFPFYLCWANESWRRNWDGLSGTVLLEQSYREGFEFALARDAMPYMRDPRYQRPDGKRPRFVIYRPEDLPDPETNVARLRQAWRSLGLGEVELGAVRFHVAGDHPVRANLFDFWVEMPPHGLVGEPDYLFGGPHGNRLGFDPTPDFRGLIYDYAAVIGNSISPDRKRPTNLITGVMPSWDNTARRGADAHIAYGANPARFARWLRAIATERLPGSYRNELFINAWNEWAEKAMLEPGTQYGRANLNVLQDWIGHRRGQWHAQHPHPIAAE